MTQSDFRRFVRREFETLTPRLQEVTALRALGRPVFAWDHLTSAELSAVYGAARAVALLSELSP